MCGTSWRYQVCVHLSLQLISGAFEHSVLHVWEVYGLYDP